MNFWEILRELQSKDIGGYVLVKHERLEDAMLNKKECVEFAQNLMELATDLLEQSKGLKDA